MTFSLKSSPRTRAAVLFLFSLVFLGLTLFGVWTESFISMMDRRVFTTLCLMLSYLILWLRAGELRMIVPQPRRRS